ncbi:hypothetical protein PIROE2DRAFT_35709, partial [Piromyces sp. E2]
IHLACMNGNLEIVKLFVELLNSDIECRDSNGYTPLYAAYINQRSNVIKYLIGKGCNDMPLSNASHKNYKYTPLHLACYNNNLDMIRFLLEKGLNINTTDCN